MFPSPSISTRATHCPSGFFKGFAKRPTTPAPSGTDQPSDDTAAEISSRILSRRLRFADGWPPEAGPTALEQLVDSNNVDQLHVIEAASLSGGFVARDESLRLIGRDPEARGVLNNFMRRTNQISDQLRRAGIIAQDARNLLYAEAPDGSAGWVRISGFRVPFQVDNETAD